MCGVPVRIAVSKYSRINFTASNYQLIALFTSGISHIMAHFANAVAPVINSQAGNFADSAFGAFNQLPANGGLSQPPIKPPRLSLH